MRKCEKREKVENLRDTERTCEKQKNIEELQSAKTSENAVPDRNIPAGTEKKKGELNVSMGD